MKKIYSFLFAAVTVFAAASCQKEVDSVVSIPEEETMTLTATVGPETKTSLHENGKSTLWTAGDMISVFDINPAGNNCCFEIATEELPAATAEFKYTGEFMRPDVNENPDPFLVALYPYQSSALCDFATTYKITGITVPSEQIAKADGFDSNATFALAVGKESTKDDLKFNNLYSLLKFTVATEGVKTVKVEVNGEAKIAGAATVQLVVDQTGITGGVLAATGSSSVTLNCEAGFTVGETYYIAIAPVSYTNLTVSLDDTVVKTVTTAKTLEANKYYNLGELSVPRFIVKGNGVWETYKLYTWNSSVTPEWPGNEMKYNESGDFYYYDLPLSEIGKTISFIVNDGSSKTADTEAKILATGYTYTFPQCKIFVAKPKENFSHSDAFYEVYFYTVSQSGSPQFPTETWRGKQMTYSHDDSDNYYYYLEAPVPNGQKIKYRFVGNGNAEINADPDYTHNTYAGFTYTLSNDNVKTWL